MRVKQRLSRVGRSGFVLVQERENVAGAMKDVEHLDAALCGEGSVENEIAVMNAKRPGANVGSRGRELAHDRPISGWPARSRNVSVRLSRKAAAVSADAFSER